MSNNDNLVEEIKGMMNCANASSLEVDVKKIVSEAFSKLGEAEQQTLYKKLSVAFHPDKQSAPSDDAWIGKCKVVQSSINQINDERKEPSFLEKMRYSNVSSKIEVATSTLNSLGKRLDRYPTLFRWPAKGFIYLLLALSVLSAGIVRAVVTLSVYIKNIIMNTLRAIMTNDTYENELSDYQATHQPEYDAIKIKYLRLAKDRHLMKFRIALESEPDNEILKSEISQIASMTLEEFEAYARTRPNVDIDKNLNKVF